MSLCDFGLFKPGFKKDPDTKLDWCLFNLFRDLLSGPVIGNPLASMGVPSSIPGLGEFCMMQSS